MRKFFRDRLPDHASLKHLSWMGPLQHRLMAPYLWHLHRRAVAGGVALGLFCGLIPGPLQMLSAALLALLLRVNLPVAVATTLYTNPFTIVPLYLLAYKIGYWVSGRSGSPEETVPVFPEIRWHDWLGQVWGWLLQLGEPLLIGLPVLAVGLALCGYVAVRVLWRCAVVWRWRKRHLHRD